MSTSIRWQYTNGDVIACTEKLKVLNENLLEIRQVAQDALEDGLLIGCCEQQMREVFKGIVEKLVNPYSKPLPDNNVINKSPG